MGFEETSFASSSQIRFLGWAFLLASPPNWFISRTDCRSRTQTRPPSQGRFSFLAVEEIWPNLYVRIWSVLNCRQISMRRLLFCLSLCKVSIDVLSQSLAQYSIVASQAVLSVLQALLLIRWWNWAGMSSWTIRCNVVECNVNLGFLILFLYFKL